MAIKPSAFMTARAERRLQVGTYISILRDPAILTILKTVGFDFARVDMEHSTLSIETVADMAQLSRALEFPIFVRPPENTPAWIGRLLDVGVAGVHCVGVTKRDEAARIVEAARYAPLGWRGMVDAGPHSDFAAVGIEERKVINKNIHISVSLESVQAFNNIDEIFSTPGIDTLALGARDLAQSAGVLGLPDEEEVIDGYRVQLIEAAKRHDKDVALVLPSASAAMRWIDAGVSIVVLKSDLSVLIDGFTEVVGEFRALL